MNYKREARLFVECNCRGKVLLRACIVNFRTSRKDIEQIIEIIAGLGRKIHHEMSVKEVDCVA